MYKNILLRTFLFSVVLVAVNSPVLRAQTLLNQPNSGENINSIVFIPVQQWINQLQSHAPGASYDDQTQINQITYASDNGDVSATLEKIDVLTKIKSESLDQLSADRLLVHLKLDSANAQIQNFNLIAKIKKDTGFGTATLTLNMHCDAINIQFKNTNPIQIPVSINRGVFTVKKLIWLTEQTEVQAEMQGCQKIAGFDQVFKDQIQKSIEQSYVKDILLSSINSRINQVINENLNRQINKYAEQYQLGLNQKIIFNEKNDILVALPEALSAFSSDEILTLQKSPHISMIIKKASLEELIKKNLNSFLEKQTIISSQQKSLNQFTCSRLEQTFLWPSLKSLNKCFEMKIQLRIELVEVVDITQLSLKLQAGAWASGEEKNLAYFKAKLDANILHTQAQLNDLKAIADPDYMKWSGRSKRISVSLLKSPLQKALSDAVQKASQTEIVGFFKNSLNFKNLNATTFFIDLKI